MKFAPELLRRMLERLPQQTVPSGERPLAALTTRASDDPAMALLDAWAEVLDILAFYQDRIAQEGYLGTAAERFSLHELARSLGYVPAPGLSASVWLVFTVQTAAGGPEFYTLEPGLAAQSVPGPGEQPQTFETIQAVSVHPAWNVLKAYAPLVIEPARITASDTGLRLAGPNSGVHKGDWLLVVDSAGTMYGPTTAARVTPAAVHADITLTAPLASTSAVIENPQVVHFAERATLFGHSAPPLPDDQKQRAGGVFCFVDGTWERRQTGLPNAAITALIAVSAPPDPAITPLLFAATDNAGIFRSADWGKHWEPCSNGLPGKKVYALFALNNETLFAGLDDGTLYHSRDFGEMWQSYSSGQIVVPEGRYNTCVITACPRSLSAL